MSMSLFRVLPLCLMASCCNKTGGVFTAGAPSKFDSDVQICFMNTGATIVYFAPREDGACYVEDAP